MTPKHLLQEIGSKLGYVKDTRKRLYYHTSKDKTWEQINIDNCRSMERVNCNKYADDSMYEKVDESDEYNVGAEEEDKSRSKSENISESGSSFSDFFNYSCIYTSGVSGTGKTATINEVMRYLNKNFNKKN